MQKIFGGMFALEVPTGLIGDPGSSCSQFEIWGKKRLFLINASSGICLLVNRYPYSLFLRAYI